jgi:predicted enzyme related to lactoylglutathione lyase
MLLYPEIFTITVSDQQAALEFYRDKLGFEVLSDEQFMPEARWINVAPKGAQSRFTLWPAGVMNDKTPGGFTGISFACDDAQATCDQFTASGVTITQAPQEVPWGIQFMFADGDGNVFNVVQGN